MVYRAVGVLSNPLTEGIDIAFAEFQENSGLWTYDLKNSVHHDYSEEWKLKLEPAGTLAAVDYQFLHSSFGSFIGKMVNQFIAENNLQFQVALITTMGLTVFYQPGKMISQLGHGAAIAAETSLPVVTDLPALDITLGGNGKFFQAIASKLGLVLGESQKDNKKKAITIALAGVLRWREEYNFLTSVTGARRDSIGGAVWLGQEA